MSRDDDIKTLAKGISRMAVKEEEEHRQWEEVDRKLGFHGREGTSPQKHGMSWKQLRPSRMKNWISFSEDEKPIPKGGDDEPHKWVTIWAHFSYYSHLIHHSP